MSKHAGADQAADQKQSPQIHIHDAVPFRDGKLLDRHPVVERVDARIVDQDVDAAAGGLHPPDSLGNLLLAGDIHAQRHGIRNLRGRLAGSGLINVRDDHCGPVVGERAGGGLPDPPGSARYERHLAC